MTEQQAKTAEMAELRRAEYEPRKLKVGDVLTYSWGYDQTNVDAFEVVRESKASVWLREIAIRSVEATGWMSDRVVPVPGEYLSEKVIVKRRKPGYRGEEIVHMDFGVGSLWKGRELHRSWYH